MDRRRAWLKVLEAEVRRWSALSCDELLAKLGDIQIYEVQFDDRPHQVEVELLTDAPRYLEVMVAVDDGTLPASISPATEIFRRQKCERSRSCGKERRSAAQPG